MNIDFLLYLIITLNFATDLIFYFNESSWDKEVPQKIIPNIGDYAPRNYDWQRELDYRKANRVFDLFSSAVGYLVLLAFFGTGLFTRLMLFLGDIRTSPFLRGFFFAFIAVLGIFLYRLPFSFYRTFVMERKFDFNRKTPSLFVKDNIISLVLFMAIVPPVAGAINCLARTSYGIPTMFIFVVSLSLILSFVFPVLIMPLFYKIRPLEESPLLERIKELVRGSGLSVNGIYMADQSRRSSRANAMVTGFGKARRIILFDTLIETMKEEGILSVLAHEMGHWKERHMLILQITAIAEQAVIFAALWIMWVSPIGKPTFGISDMVLPRLVVIIYIISSLMGLVLSPLESAVSRKLEFRADKFAAEHTSGKDMCGALADLATKDLAWIPPSPLHAIWISSHPSIPERILRIRAS